MTEDTICPSCGLEKEEDVKDKPLCRYCYLRNTMGTMKMLVMAIFDDEEKMTVAEISKKLNKSPYIRRPVPIPTLKKYLRDYTRWGMLSSSKERLKHNGRPNLLYMITVKGKRRLEAYKNKWENGHIVNLRKRHMKLRTNKSGFSERASEIRGKMLMDKNYNSFEFIFPQRIPAKHL